MKKKVAGSVKRSPAKPHITQAIRNRSTMPGKKPPVPQHNPTFKEDPGFAQAVQNYEVALRAMQEHKYEKAKALLEKIITGAQMALIDRARVHLNLCNQQLASSATTFKTHEEHFDYAVSLMNAGQFDQARTHMEKILKGNAKADFAYYGMAVVDCLTGQVESSLKHLSEAIRLNPHNRFQARNDSDFQNMADDPRFTELLYPEPTDPPPSSSEQRKH
jgi:tetratricopeptide (TPR) repeat protein